MDQNLSRMQTGTIHLGVEDHDEIGSEYLKKRGFSDIVCQMVGGHVNAKRYLVYKDKTYHDGKA